MLMHFARTKPNKCARIGRQRRLNVNSPVLVTTQTVAMARLTGLNDTQLKKVRSHLKHVGAVDLKLSKKELTEIDNTVGMDTETSVAHGCHTCEWATSEAKGKEKKPPEVCEHWNSDILKEIAAETDPHLKHRFTKEEHLLTPPSLDCGVAGFEGNGILSLIGGDHGDKACPTSAKMNLVSPVVRKGMKDLNCQCPTVQIASIDCPKDVCDLLKKTAMPRTRTQLILSQGSAAVVVCNRHTPRKRFRTVIVQGSINLLAAQFNEAFTGDIRQLSMTCSCHNGYNNNCQRASCATCRRDPCTLLHELPSADSARSQTMQRH